VVLGVFFADTYAVAPLTMPRIQKIALLIVVSLGVIVIVAAIARCVSVIKLPLNDPLCKFASLHQKNMRRGF